MFLEILTIFLIKRTRYSFSTRIYLKIKKCVHIVLNITFFGSIVEITTKVYQKINDSSTMIIVISIVVNRARRF